MKDISMIADDSISLRVGIRRPTDADADEFVAMAQVSATYHHPWVDPPKTRERFDTYLKSRQVPTDDGFLICERATGKIAGVINLNCIVPQDSSTRPIWATTHSSNLRKGYMTEGMKLVMHHAFTEMKLHRLEANIQPENLASISLARKCGFRKEGFSPKYLQVFGEWRDHERWALVAEP